MVELGYFKHTTFEFPISFGNSYTIVSYFIDDLIIAPKINYSANLSITNKQMEYIGVHFISLNYYIGLKEK